MVAEPLAPLDGGGCAAFSKDWGSIYFIALSSLVQNHPAASEPKRYAIEYYKRQGVSF